MMMKKYASLLFALVLALSLSVSAAADAALVTRDSVRTEEMLSSSKTLEMASQLVYHSGALLHSLPQSKAVRPASRASTARME